MADAGVSEYEAKRLRRMEENRRQLQALHLPTLRVPLKKEKTESQTQQKRKAQAPAEPTRRSKRQRRERETARERQLQMDKYLAKQERKRVRTEEKRQRKMQEKREQRRLEKEQRLQRRLERRLQRQQREEQKQKKVALHAEKCRLRWRAKHEKKKREEEQERRAAEERRRQWMRMKDWRLRRKLQAREEHQLAMAKVRVKRTAQKLKEKLKEQIQLRKQMLMNSTVRKGIKKRRVEQRRQERLEARDQQRIERHMMKAEDTRSRALEKLEAKKLARREKKDARIQKMEHENRKKYPVRRVKDVPYVHIKGALVKSREKPAALTRELQVDVDFFHAFSLGKQFLPASKNSVMQALCPSGMTAAFDDRVDIHVWSNAMALFVRAGEGGYLDRLLKEAWLDGERCAFFRWSRTSDVTPEITDRIFEIEKGDERLRFDDNYYDPPTPIGRPQPLLLFIQFPQGPFIYCGRLGYLGHRDDPLEFYFQLLDIGTTYWAQLRSLLTY
ncbi:Reticulocyte-binding protein 2 a [Phytophthora cinnamomi]|uniref:Reticulocyte-binding protein 2 a n=1 Tax=Phytophthora cinnamomi TaxID=4785 RepID=UPI003559D176|nr:Reticulocyte-binding protein 2 a [Phytophthora cinnamomi]